MRILNQKMLTLLFATVLLAGSAHAQVIPPEDQPLKAETPAVAQSEVTTEPQTEGTLGVLPEAPAVTAKGPLAPEVLILMKIEEDLKEKYKKEIYIPPSIPSLIFTPLQQTLLREARNGFNTRIPTEAELKGVPATSDIQRSPIASVRSLALGGIVFISPDDWTIWLNKKRITTATIPTEAVDLRVYKDFIELRWYDAQTNQIYPIRLRPNQKFNLDAHTFVPG